MNWIDFALIGFVILYGFIGYWRGFILSIFKIVSFFLSIFISIKCYPLVSKILISQFNIDVPINNIIKNNVAQSISDAIHGATNISAANNAISSIGLPSGLENTIQNTFNGGLSVANQTVDQSINTISQSFTDITITIISILVTFVCVSIILFFAKFLIASIAKLPILSQINHGGGFIFGIIQGIAFSYIICALFALCISIDKMNFIYTDIQASTIVKHIYENNIILNWVFKN